jgi:hypothetical protein
MVAPRPPAGLLVGPWLFLRSRRIAAGTCALLVIGALAYAFGATSLPLVPGGDRYTGAVTFAAAPIAASTAALGIVGSRLAMWEARAARGLIVHRCALVTVCILLPVLSLAPAAATAPMAAPERTEISGCLACMGIGLAIGPLARYEIRAGFVVAYGVASLMFRPTAGRAADYLCLVGMDTSGRSLLIAVCVAAFGGATYVLGHQP